mgnify:CR=1 FL=1
MAVYLNNQFVDNEDAVLHVSDLSIQRGYAVFDFFRATHGMPLFMQDHLDRFFASSAAMHLPVKQSREELADIIMELLKRTAIPVAGIKMMITGGYSPDLYQPTEPNLFITCSPIKVSTEADFNKGIHAITYEYQRDMPHIKSINYQLALWLQPLLKEKKADDVLYFKNNIVTEFPRNNLFMLTADDKLVTPAHNILLGVTRKKIIALAADMIAVEERDITVDELFTARELFLSSSMKRILPVINIDGKPVADGQPGSFTKRIYQKFRDLEERLVQAVSL